MGLREVVQAGILAGMSAIGNLKETVTYKVNGTPVYNATTGASTRVETSYTVDGLFYEYSKREIDGATVRPHDMKFIFHQNELAATPTLQDRLVRSTGKIWEVISVDEDPAHATWILQIRSGNG